MTMATPQARAMIRDIHRIAGVEPYIEGSYPVAGESCAYISDMSTRIKQQTDIILIQLLADMTEVFFIIIRTLILYGITILLLAYICLLRPHTKTLPLQSFFH
jgi:hypothetical protein